MLHHIYSLVMNDSSSKNFRELSKLDHRHSLTEAVLEMLPEIYCGYV